MNNQDSAQTGAGLRRRERIRRNSRILAVFARMPAFLAALTSEKRTLMPEVSSLAPGGQENQLQRTTNYTWLRHG